MQIVIYFFAAAFAFMAHKTVGCHRRHLSGELHHVHCEIGVC